MPVNAKVVLYGLLNAALMASGMFFQKLNGAKGGSPVLSGWLALALLCFAPTFWVANHVFEIGGRMSLFVPMSAAMYVLTTLLGRFYFGEVVPASSWLGVGLVLAGVGLIARG